MVGWWWWGSTVVVLWLLDLRPKDRKCAAVSGRFRADDQPLGKKMDGGSVVRPFRWTIGLDADPRQECTSDLEDVSQR